MAREDGMLKTPRPKALGIPETSEKATPPWLETQAEVTACRYVFSRMNTLTLGIASDCNRYRVSYTYYAHATIFRDEFNSFVAMEQGKTFPVFYDPLNPRENRPSVPGATAANRGLLFGLGIAGSIIISFVYLTMVYGCN